MCLAVPGRLCEWIERDSVFARAWIEFDAVRRECYMACVPEAEVGDYVIVHAGVAISRVDADAAQCILDEFRRLETHAEAEPSTIPEEPPAPGNPAQATGVPESRESHRR
jgi:hydrogenase expression/formation protein HypC